MLPPLATTEERGSLRSWLWLNLLAAVAEGRASSEAGFNAFMNSLICNTVWFAATRGRICHHLRYLSLSDEAHEEALSRTSGPCAVSLQRWACTRQCCGTTSEHWAALWLGEAWLYSRRLAVAMPVNKTVCEGGTGITWLFVFQRCSHGVLCFTAGGVSGPLCVAEKSVS